MAVLKIIIKSGVLIDENGDRLVDENGNGFSIVEGPFILKANEKILIRRNNQ